MMTGKKFLNISNHPSSGWNGSQLLAAEYYGDIVDIPFPKIVPEASTEEISVLADEYVRRIEDYDVAAVMVQGEFTFSYSLIKRLRERGITVVAACTRRQVKIQEMPDGSVSKISIFAFSGFREYE